MEREHMSRWGIGPLFVLISSLITIVGILINRFIDLKFAIAFLPQLVLYAIGICFCIFGIIIWFSGAFLSKIVKNIKEDKLITNGVYGYVRNPIYSGIWFFLTGILICQGSYILLILPILFYILLRLFVQKEEKILTEYFGKEYLEYRQNTNAVFPCIKKLKLHIIKSEVFYYANNFKSKRKNVTRGSKKS